MFGANSGYGGWAQFPSKNWVLKVIGDLYCRVV